MKYQFAAEIPKSLAEEVRQTIDLIRASPAPEEHMNEGADLVLRLTKACLESYFLHSVRALEVGFVAEKATAVGVNTAHRAIALFIHRITGSLSQAQILRLADILEGMLVTR